MGCTGTKATPVRASPPTVPGSTLLTTPSAGKGKPTKIPSEVSIIESVPSVASFAPEVKLGASQTEIGKADPVLPGGVPSSPLGIREEAEGRQVARCNTAHLSDNVECLPSVAHNPKKKQHLEETWAEAAQSPDLSTSVGIKPWGEEVSVRSPERSRSACEVLPAGALLYEEAATDVGEVTTPMVLADACNEAAFPSQFEPTRRSESLTPEGDLTSVQEETTSGSRIAGYAMARTQDEKSPSSLSSKPPGVEAEATVVAAAAL